MKGKTPTAHLVRRIREATWNSDKYLLARYGKEVETPVAEVYHLLREKSERRISVKDFSAHTVPEDFRRSCRELGRMLLAFLLIDAEEKDGTAFREIAELIDHGIPCPVDRVRAALCEERATVHNGGPLHSAKELQALTGDGGSLRAFRKKIKDVGCPVRKEQGKGGGRPRKPVTRNRGWQGI